MKNRSNKFTIKFVIYFLSFSLVWFFYGGISTSGAMAANKYETPGLFDAKDILSRKYLKGPYHRVDDGVVSYGYDYHFFIKSDFGEFDANGLDNLKIRIQELNAIAALRKMKKGKVFVDASKKALKAPVSAMKNLIDKPVDTITGIPKGIFRVFGRIGTVVKTGRGEQEESFAKELIGFSGVKRKIAHKLNVDVYSSNKVLQKEMNSVSWTAYAGGVTITAAFAAIRTVGMALNLVKGTKRLNDLLRDKSPEDLRKLNQEKLERIGVNSFLIKHFISHPQFSPRHQTFLVGSLEDIVSLRNPGDFIQLAASAVESEESAFLYQRIAEMAHSYHKKKANIIEVISNQGFPMFMTRDRSLVILLPMDHPIWSKRSAGFVYNLVNRVAKRYNLRKIEVWVTGSLSGRLRNELHRRKLKSRKTHL